MPVVFLRELKPLLSEELQKQVLGVLLATTVFWGLGTGPAPVSPGRSHRTLGSGGLGTWFNALYILEVLKFCIPFGPGILQFQFASCVAGSGQW